MAEKAPVRSRSGNLRKVNTMATEELTADQWRRIAVEALADLQSIGMDIKKLKFVQGFPDTVLKEVERYFWNREDYN